MGADCWKTTTMFVESGLGRTDPNGDERTGEVERGVGPAHSADAAERHDQRDQSRTGECGQPRGEVVDRDGCSLLLRRQSREYSTHRYEGDHSHTENDSCDSQSKDVGAEQAGHVVEAEGGRRAEPAAIPAHLPHPAEAVADPPPEKVTEDCDSELDTPDRHPLAHGEPSVAVAPVSEVERHDDWESVEAEVADNTNDGRQHNLTVASEDADPGGELHECVAQTFRAASGLVLGYQEQADKRTGNGPGQ